VARFHARIDCELEAWIAGTFDSDRLLQQVADNRDGLVAQLVEQCPFNSNSPIFAVFSSGCFRLASLAELLISLAETPF